MSTAKRALDFNAFTLTHSWLNRFRHLLIRWAKKPENYLAMLQFACARITWYK